MSKSGTDRKHEIEMRIKASPEQVWKALTDADELTHWFPPEAEVVPGEGGKIVMSWGELSGTSKILAWEPNRRLRCSWPEPGPFEGGATVTEYVLEADGDHTLLRFVHSGFGHGDAWDKQYEGTGRGWRTELRSLRHYLERHAGKPRRSIWVRHEIKVPREEAWKRLMSARGLGGEGRLDGLGEGDRYSIETSSGDRLEGTVQVYDPPCDFAATVDSMDGAMMRLGLEECFGAPEADIWLHTWGDPGEVDDIRERWTTMLRELFPEG